MTKKNKKNKFYYYVEPTFNEQPPKKPEKFYEFKTKSILSTYNVFDINEPLINVLSKLAKAFNKPMNSIYIQRSSEDEYDDDIDFYTLKIQKKTNIHYKAEMEQYKEELQEYKKAKQEHNKLLEEYKIWQKNETKKIENAKIKNAVALLKKNNFKVEEKK